MADEAKKRHMGLMAGVFIGRIQASAWRDWGRKRAAEKEQELRPRGFVRTSSSGGIYR